MLRFPHSDLAYRALLRNMKLLAGMRGSKSSFRVLVAGLEAGQVAEQLRKLEKGLVVELGGDDGPSIDAALASHAGSGLDGIVVTQAYHVLTSRDALAKAARAALDDDEGTLGLLWHRALPEGTPAASAFTAAVTAASANRTSPASSSSSLPLLAPDDSPLTWVEKELSLATAPPNTEALLDKQKAFLPGCAIPFRPLKHRKFVETIKPQTVDEAAALLRCTHDLRLQKASAATVEAGLQALRKQQQDGAKDPLSLQFDFHAFHTSVIPTQVK